MDFVTIAASSDGAIAENNRGIEWLNEQPIPSSSNDGYAEFVSKINTFLMGRNAFEKILSFGQWR